MNAENFIDTNVYIYLFDETDVRKRRLAENLIYQSLERGTGCISFQVVQETLNVLTRKLGAGPCARLLLDDVLVPLWHINPTPDLYRRGLALQTRYHFSFYDSLIVAASLEGNYARLYSEDLQHGQQIQGFTGQSRLIRGGL